MLRKFGYLSLLLFAILGGCGSSGGGPGAQPGGGGDGGNGSVPVQATRTVLLRHVVGRAVPADTSHLQLTCFNAVGSRIFGPLTRNFQTELEVGGLPAETFRIELRYLRGTIVFGYYSWTPEFDSANYAILIDPGWEDFGGVGSTGSASTGTTGSASSGTGTTGGAPPGTSATSSTTAGTGETAATGSSETTATAATGGTGGSSTSTSGGGPTTTGGSGGATTLRNKIWVGELRITGGDYQPDLLAFDPSTLTFVTPAALDILVADGFAAFDFGRGRVYGASSKGLNILDADSGEHLPGSPFHAGGLAAGTSLFPSILNRRGFRVHEVAYDGDRDRIYLATTQGLYVMNGADFSLVAGSPLASSAADSEATGVAYDATRGQIYVITSEDGGLSGDNNAISIFDADSLSPVTGSPFIPPGIQTLMHPQIMLDEAGGKLYTTSATRLTRFDITSRTFTTVTRHGATGSVNRGNGQILVAEENVLAVVSPAGQLELYNLSDMTPATGSPIPLQSAGRAVAYDATTRRYFVSTVGGIEVFQAPGLAAVSSSPLTGPTSPSGFGYYFITKVP